MELEELKKSWNALDEHLKDKEFIKEEELEKLIRHADKGIHAIASLNIKLILISLPILILFLAEVLLHNRLNPIYIIIIFAWIPALCWDIVTTRFLQRTQIDEMPLVEVISRVNRIHRWTIRERLIAIAFLLVLAVLSFIYWQVWQYGIGMIENEKVILLEPQTYMNLSGEAIKPMLDFYKVDPSNLLVIYDDIDVEPGKVKIRTKGGPGTHNGMKSVVKEIGTEEFPRIRVGIGQPIIKLAMIDYVIGYVPEKELTILEEGIEKAEKAIEEILKHGINYAMNKFN